MTQRSPSTRDPGSERLVERSLELTEIRIPTRRFLGRLVGTCVLALLALVLIHLLVEVWQGTESGTLKRLGSLSEESGPGSWLYGVLLLMVSLTLWLIHFSSRPPGSAWRWLSGWSVLAFVSTATTIYAGALLNKRLLDVSESVQEGESTLGPLMNWLTVPLVTGYAWQVLIQATFGGLAVFSGWFLWAKMTDRLDRAILAVLVVGSLVSVWLGRLGGVDPGDLLVSTTAVVRMLCLTLFWLLLLRYLSSLPGPLQWRFAAARDSPAGFVVDGPGLAWNLLGICVLLEVIFVGLDYHLNYSDRASVSSVQGLFNLAREDSLSSWFGVTQSWMIGLTLSLIAVLAKVQGDGRRRVFGWLVLALFFAYMSLDDGGQVHERLGSIVSDRIEQAAEEPPTSGERVGWFPSYGWQVLFVPVFGIVGVFLLFFLWGELAAWPLRALIACALACFVLAVGLDFVEGLNDNHPWNLQTRISALGDLEDFARDRFDATAGEAVSHFSKVIEEFLEMLGNSLLWAVVVDHAVRRVDGLRVRFE